MMLVDHGRSQINIVSLLLIDHLGSLPPLLLRRVAGGAFSNGAAQRGLLLAPHDSPLEDDVSPRRKTDRPIHLVFGRYGHCNLAISGIFHSGRQQRHPAFDGLGRVSAAPRAAAVHALCLLPVPVGVIRPVATHPRGGSGGAPDQGQGAAAEPWPNAPNGHRLPERLEVQCAFRRDGQHVVPLCGGKGGLVMAALDNRTEAYFQRRGIETIRVFPEDFSGDPYIAEAVLHSKVEIPYVFLLKGLRVVMVEMDIFCRANPLLLDTGTADVVVSEHGNSAEVNVGFWVAYPTCPVIDAFRRMRAWATDPQRRNAYCDGAFDQKIMHYAWLGTGALSPRSKSKCRHFSQRDQLFDPRVDSPVALEMISYQRIMHWMEDDHDDDVNDDDNAEGGSRDPDLEAKAWAPNSTDTVCVHLWSSFGSPHAQAQYGYQHSWYPPESEREAKHAACAFERVR